jgi:hypothetical protein
MDGGPGDGGDGTGDDDAGDGGTGDDDGGDGDGGSDDGGTDGGGTGGGTDDGGSTGDGPCNNDGTCDPGETAENCPNDCPPAGELPWCDDVYWTCLGDPLGPGKHHNLCVQIEEGRWTSNPTYEIHEREYSIYLPSNYNGQAGLPLYVWLHHYDVANDPSLIEEYFDALDTPGANASPDDTGAIFMAPISPDNWALSEWSFVWQALQTVACLYQVDGNRIYLGGKGSGGSTTLVLGWKDSEWEYGFGVKYLAAIGAHSVGNEPGTLIDTDPCVQDRQVPTFLASGGPTDVNRGKVQAWLNVLEGCYEAENFTFYQYPSGSAWTPESFGLEEWPWLSQWVLP